MSDLPLPPTQEPTKKKKAAKKKAVFAGIGDGVKVEVSAIKGRCLLATSRLCAGQVVLRERPVAVVPHERGTICEGCGRTDPPTPLFVLDFAFCSATCASKAQVNEELHEVWRRLPEIASRRSCSVDLLRMVLRLYLLTASSSQESQESQESRAAPYFTKVEVAPGVTAVRGTAAAVLLLESHIDKQQPSWLASVRGAVNDMAHLLALPEEAGEAMLTLAGRVNVNAYGVSDRRDPRRSLGFCLAPVVGLTVNHSCAPNVQFSFSPSHGCMEYRALRDIEAGEEVLVSYVDLVQDTPSRRAALLRSKHFHCSCARCNAADSALAAARDGPWLDALTLGADPLSLLADDFADLGGGAGAKKKGTKSASSSSSSSSSSSTATAAAAAAAAAATAACTLADLYLGGLSCRACPSGSGVVVTLTEEAGAAEEAGAGWPGEAGDRGSASSFAPDRSQAHRQGTDLARG